MATDQTPENYITSVPNTSIKLLFVEMGVGYDQHGQDVTKAAMRACRDAIASNSIPAFRRETGAVRIPMFDREHYAMWKKKMLLFLQVANPKYLNVLKTGPKVPMIYEAEIIENNLVVAAARSYPKDPKEYTVDEKEDSILDANLQLILVDCLDPVMHNHVLNCKDAKHIWETIEIINEGTEEVRENEMEILTFAYEHFRSNPGEGISEIFERYNKLINDMNLHGKYYTVKEINKKFLLTLPTHLEHRISAIREARDLSEISLERLYGVLKTYELEQIQQKEIYGEGRVAGVSQKQEEAKVVLPSSPNKDVIVAEYGATSTSQSGGDFYSLEELEQLENESMALIVKRFGNFRFRRNPNFKFKTNADRYQTGGSSSSNSTRGGYKTGMVDRSTIRCFNCNELGHFATECRNQRQAKKTSHDTYKKNKFGKAYLAEGKSWDDTDSEDEEVGNLVLVAIENKVFTSTPSYKGSVPGVSSDQMKLQIKLGVPRPLQSSLDIQKVKSVFPYGDIMHIEVVDGGLICSSGTHVEELGDKNDDCYIVNAAVYVGY